MDKTSFYNLIGFYPHIEELISLTDSLDPAEWGKFTYRQKTIVGHKQTLTIPLVFDYAKKSRNITHKNYEIFKDHLALISDIILASNYPGEIKRANIVCLLPNSEISPHMDKGDFLQKTRRIHLPIHTNSDCHFVVGGIKQRFGVGEMWEINNTGQVHSVHNLGDYRRIHLVVDVG
jgi:hypothetical protein